MSKAHSFITRYSFIWIFLLFFVVTLGLKFTNSGLFSADDPYYHARHAANIWQGTPMHLPTTSTWEFSNPYMGYHLLMAPFTAGFQGTSYQTLIDGVKIFHALIVALLFSTFYLVCAYIFKTYLKISRYYVYAFIATMFLFSVSSIFTLRILLDRPHILSVLFLFLSYYVIVRKKWWLLGILSILFPFFYSVSFIILVPGILYILAKAVYERSLKLHYFIPTGIITVGLLFGILLRPDSYYYLYTSYFAICVSVWNSLTHKTIEGGELQPFTIDTFQDGLTLLCGGLVLGMFLFSSYQLLRKHKKTNASFEKYFTLTIASFFLLLFIVIVRASEYFIPFLVLATAWIVIDDIIPTLHILLRTSRPHNVVDRKIVSGIQTILQEVLVTNKNLFKYIVSFCFFILFISNGVYALSKIAIQKPFDRYQHAAEFIAQRSSDSHIVFNHRFDMYPQLVFYNSKDRYVIGGGSTGTYLRNEHIYWLWQNIVLGKTICRQQTCRDGDAEDLYTVLKNDFKASFVFIDSQPLKNDSLRNGLHVLIERLDADSRFKKVFVDPQYPEVMIYSL